MSSPSAVEVAVQAAAEAEAQWLKEKEERRKRRRERKELRRAAEALAQQDVVGMERERTLKDSRGAGPKFCPPNQDTHVYPTQCSPQHEGLRPTRVLVLHYLVRQGMIMVVSFPPPLLQVHTFLQPKMTTKRRLILMAECTHVHHLAVAVVQRGPAEAPTHAVAQPPRRATDYRAQSVAPEFSISKSLPIAAGPRRTEEEVEEIQICLFRNDSFTVVHHDLTIALTSVTFLACIPSGGATGCQSQHNRTRTGVL